MAAYVTDDAVCLRVTDFSETSQIAALFTRAHGLVPLIAKGAKRHSKKGNTGTVSGPLDLLSRGEVVFIPPKAAAELGTLSAWELSDPRNALRGNLPAFNVAMVIAELTTLLLHPHDPHTELYDEFNAALALAGGEHRVRGLVAYAKAALSETGYAPRFNACLVCGTAIVSDIPLRYSTRGGVVCPNCSIEGQTIATTGLIAIALERLPAPSAILSSPPERVGDLLALRSALELLITHAEAVTDRRLRTRGILAALFPQPTTKLST